MSVNKFKPHVWVIPEDDANRQIVGGFLLHDTVDDRAVGVRAPAGGWPKVLEIFESEYLPLLRESSNAHVVMLIDFDLNENRREHFEIRIPEEVRSRVFVVGSKDEPEVLRRELGMAWEPIGAALAQECHEAVFKLWRHPHLIHNEADLQRMVQIIRPILFEKSK